MVIHAYFKDYLSTAQKILGDMMDYAVKTYRKQHEKREPLS